MTIRGADREAFLEKAVPEQTVPASLAGWEPAWWTSGDLREEGEQGQIRALPVRPGPGSWSSGKCRGALAGKDPVPLRTLQTFVLQAWEQWYQ